MDFNPDCNVEGCERESIDKSGLCKKHAATSQPQEWTAETIARFATTGERSWQSIADAHNAALADLRKYYETVRYRGLIEREARLSDELAAERKKLQDWLTKYCYKDLDDIADELRKRTI
jgi:hypothetical protein